jgi:hypothetical protein
VTVVRTPLPGQWSAPRLQPQRPHLQEFALGTPIARQDSKELELRQRAAGTYAQGRTVSDLAQMGKR